MATRRGPSISFSHLRCDALEPRATPAVDFGAGFTAAGLPGGLPAGYAAGDLLLTDGPFQAAAVWAPAPVHVQAFRTSFVFRLEGEPGRLGDGFTFALSGAQPAGPGAAGGGLGYAGLANSVAVKFDLVDNAGEGGHSVGVFTGGADPTVPAVRLDDTPIHLHAQHPIRADLAYDGTTLTLTLTDTTLPDHTWTHAFPVDIPAAVGGPTAYAGFTAGTGELFARQAIESWTLADPAPVDRPPEITTPIAVQVLGPGHLNLNAQATDDGPLSALTYAWEVVSAPDGARPQLVELPGLFPGTTRALADDGYGGGPHVGKFTFRLTVRDADGQAATRDLTYDFGTVVTRVQAAPGHPTVPAGGTIPFAAVEYDGAGHVVADPVTPSWSVVSGPGTIDAFGRYTAPAGASGPVTVRARVSVPVSLGSGSVQADATVLIEAGPPDGRLDFAAGFVLSSLSESGSARVTDDHVLRLTDGAYQAGGAFAGPVDVRGFATAFEFRVGDGPSGRPGDGLTFVLQNAGTGAVGRAGGGLGYQGITDSVAVKFDLVDNAGEGTDSVGVFTGGAEPTTPADRPVDPIGAVIDLHSGHVFRVELTYAAGVLHVELRDTVTGAAFAQSYRVDIPAAVGGSTAYAGFTAGTGELFAPIDVRTWSYTPTAN